MAISTPENPSALRSWILRQRIAMAFAMLLSGTTGCLPYPNSETREKISTNEETINLKEGSISIYYNPELTTAKTNGFVSKDGKLANLGIKVDEESVTTLSSSLPESLLLSKDVFCEILEKELSEKGVPQKMVFGFKPAIFIGDLFALSAESVGGRTPASAVRVSLRIEVGNIGIEQQVEEDEKEAIKQLGEKAKFIPLEALHEGSEKPIRVLGFIAYTPN
ncbi:MAG: hypothetical protein PHU71_01490 [Candidatus Gracilibacteria bacterium]|nr:hypothetical protein [Candidatus Gracilibacteria bacterium]